MAYMAKERSGAQDAAKGIMIIVMVLFHAYLLVLPDRFTALNTFNPIMAVLPYLMPVFFFYAGYNHKPSNRTFGQYVARRAKQLLIPMVVAFAISAIVISAMELAFHHDDPVGTLRTLGEAALYGAMSEPLVLLVGYPDPMSANFELVLGLCIHWFLLALFVCSVFFFLLVKFTNKGLPNLVSVVGGLLLLGFVLGEFAGPYLPYSVNAYPVILALMLVGSYLKQKNFLDKELKTKKDIALMAANAIVAEAIVVGAVLFSNARFGSFLIGGLAGGKFDEHLRGIDAFVTLPFALLGVYALHAFCRLLVHIPALGFGLRWIGAHSALFYVFHPICLDFAQIAFFQKNVVWGIWQSLVYVLIALAMLSLLAWLLDYVIKKRKDAKEASMTPSQGE